MSNSFYYLYFCYFLLQNPYYKDSFFCIKNLQIKRIDFDTIDKLCDLFNCSLGELLEHR
ncbi:hypothetical protein COL30_28215 [Bacillus pseudomycoides]|nr:hypothetical protein COO19_27175 [Bacillus pseudomycoides]PEI90261.1 hypothetical protein CN686_24560 [Bacillus pseudomycoides]PEM64172.1 hypothetical protein CN619_28160 [Bacillus pseudomycoides]PEO10141.1 hypothetical protein CN542_22940 [Bacillus pseudomycoides]PEP49956.1 hypothetical protein CN591_29705 [Bacillus pseudomycoides]